MPAQPYTQRAVAEPVHIVDPVGSAGVGGLLGRGEHDVLGQAGPQPGQQCAGVIGELEVEHAMQAGHAFDQRGRWPVLLPS